MSIRENNHDDDAEFEAFLRGEDELSRRLRQLPQPKPSDELSATILAEAEAALRKPQAANDPAVPPALQSPPPTPHFLRRARVPLGLAASVLLATLLVLKMQNGGSPAQPPLLAQAPSVSAPAPQAPAPVEEIAGTPPPRPASTHGRERTKQAVVPPQEPPAMIAQADIPDSNNQTVMRSVPYMGPPATPAAAPAPVPAPAAAPALSPAPASKAEEPKAWLKLIDELLRADLKRDAQEEWQKFRKAYPKYPVPDDLAARFGANDKAPAADRKP